MLIIWGTRLFGKVDEVPGMFHVATRFFHLWYFPLIPMGSTLVLEKTGRGWRGVEVGMSGKSILLAWARAGLLVGAVIVGIAGMVELSDRRPSAGAGSLMIAAAAVMLGAAVASWFIPMFSRASYERAVQLAEKVGLREEGMVLIELAYKRVSEADARATMEQLRSDAQAMEELARAKSVEEVPLAPPTAPTGPVGARR